MTKSLRRIGLAVLATFALGTAQHAQSSDPLRMTDLPPNHGHVNATLFLGAGTNQPLIVGFGGAEGGNLFASDFAKAAIDGYLAKGYAFLAIGYFGAPGAPKILDRIALEGVHEAISKAASDPKVNRSCIAVLGGSKGGELALLLASYYPDIKAVVGLVPGSSVFAAHTDTADTSAWSLNGKALPFVPVPQSAAPFFFPPNRNLRLAWEEMLKDKEAVEKAAIAVEKINGPILLVSATRDEYWPSTEMSEVIGQRLKSKNFPFKFEHVAIQGVHNDVYAHPNLPEDFLSWSMLQQSAAGCPRSR